MKDAQRRASVASERERALIDALGARYTPSAPEEPSASDEAHAEAMQQVAARYPEDAAVQVLLANASMDLQPWAYLTKKGETLPDEEG